MRTIKDLRNYQKRVCNFIFANDKNFLMVDMGLGKTVSVLTVFNELKYNRFLINNALVIAPPRVALTTWPDEIEEWSHLNHLTVKVIAGTPKKRERIIKEYADIYTISVNNIVWLRDQFPERLPFDWIIIDESSCFKSPNAQRFKALKSVIGFKGQRVSLLSGTPAPNGAQDLWAQLYLLDKGNRLGRTITEFRNNYCSSEPIAGTNAKTYSVNEQNSNIIMSKIKDITISLKSEDYIELPEAQFIDVWVQMSTKDKDSYEDFKKEKVLEMLSAGEPITAQNAAGLSNKLRQFANGFVYQYDVDSEENIPYDIHELKLDALEEIIDSAQGRPVICVYVYQHDRDRVYKRFKKLNPRILGKGKQGRQDLKDWNEGKIKLLIFHAASAGHGLNLQKGGNIMAFLGMGWGLELYQQVIKRIHRSGQTESKVLLYRILTKGTIDARIKSALTGKASGQSAMLDAVKDIINEVSDTI